LGRREKKRKAFFVNENEREENEKIRQKMEH
jgi:hypothetical protein